jgi:hypothetical protein
VTLARFAPMRAFTVIEGGLADVDEDETAEAAAWRSRTNPLSSVMPERRVSHRLEGAKG